jgi:hypothetical protein
MGDQHIAALEQGTRITQFDALGIAVGARYGGAGRGGNKRNQGSKRIHGRAILECAKEKA